MKILSWDIEASNLAADFGIVLCVGFKTVGEGKPEVLNILDYLNGDNDLIHAEKRLLKDVSKKLLDTDCWLTHFGQYYDVPFVNTRLLYHGLPVLPMNFPMVDTWRVSKNGLKLRNNRLKTISEFLGTGDEKNAIKPEQWLRALGGHRKSMDYIVEHCRLDVLVLEQVYLKVRPLVKQHPNVAKMDGHEGCSNCGSKKIQKRGFHLTAGHVYQRFQCMKCGAWGRGQKAIR